MQTEAIKLRLIQQIMDMHDDAKLRKLGMALESIDAEDFLLSKLIRPMRKKLDIEELKKEQNYRGLDKQAFFQKIEKLQVKESIEQLLAMI